MGFTGLLDFFTQRSDRQNYNDLLTRYGYGPGQNNPDLGPVQQAQPGAQFLMEASANPMFGKNILEQMQREQGALNLQKQAQDWSVNNMTMAQRGEQDIRENELLNNLTYQRGMLDNTDNQTLNQLEHYRTQAANEQTRLKQERENYLLQDARDRQRIAAARAADRQPTVGGYKADEGKMWVLGPNGPTQQFLPGSKGARDNSLILNNLVNGLGSIDEYTNYLDNYGASEWWNSGAKGKASGNFQNIITARAALGNSGVVQPGELPRLSAGLLDPMASGWNLFKRTGAAKGSAAQTKIDIQNKIADIALQNPELVTPEIAAKIAPILEERRKYNEALQKRKK